MTSIRYKIGVIGFFFILMCGVLNAQVNIKVSSEQDENRKKKTGIITINVEEGQSEYSYYLFTDYPWKDGKKIKSYGPTTETRYTFRKLKDGFYVVAVQDISKEGKFEGVVIDNN